MKAWTPAPECLVLARVLLGKNSEQLLDQEILEEEDICLPHIQGWWLSLSPGLCWYHLASEGEGDAHGELGATCHQYPMAKAERWPPRSHVTILDCGMGISRWCLAPLVERSFLCFPWAVGIEQPLPEPARMPACNDSRPESRRGLRPLCNPISSAWAPLLLLHLFIDPSWENLSSAGHAGTLLMGVGGEGRGGGPNRALDHLFPPKGRSNNSHVYKTSLQLIVFAKGELPHQRLFPLPLLGGPSIF